MRGVSFLDRTDEKILDLMKGNARISFRELGDKIGMSRVAAKKRVRKLEQEGIIRGYNTYIFRKDEITMLIDIVTVPGELERVAEYVSEKTAFVRQIFRTTKENHLHIVAVSDSAENLRYLTRMICKDCGEAVAEMQCHPVKEVIKDVYGGIRYGKKESVSDSDGGNESGRGSGSS